MTNETATTILDFPDINNGFIGASSMEEICRNYIEALHSTGDIINGMYANKLYEFLDAIEKIPFLDEEFHELQVFLRNLVKQIQDLHIKVEFNQELITLEHFALKALTRRKNWKSLNAKIRLFLCKYMNLIQKESINLCRSINLHHIYLSSEQFSNRIQTLICWCLNVF